MRFEDVYLFYKLRLDLSWWGDIFAFVKVCLKIGFYYRFSEIIYSFIFPRSSYWLIARFKDEFLLCFVVWGPPIFGILYIVPDMFPTSIVFLLLAFGDKNDWLCKVIIGIFILELVCLLILGLINSSVVCIVMLLRRVLWFWCKLLDEL